MKSIGEIMEYYSTVSFCINDDVKERFVEECKQYGYRFNRDELLTVESCGRFMALDEQGKRISYVSGIHWGFSLRGVGIHIIDDYPFKVIIHCNYKEYIAGNRKCFYDSHSELC